MFNKKEPVIVHHKHNKLFLCEKCYCWNGFKYFPPAPNSPKGTYKKVTCTCKKIKCKTCSYEKCMPGTLIWRLEDKCSFHVPSYVGFAPCTECGGRMEK